MFLFILFISYQILQFLILPILIVYFFIRYLKGKPVFGNFKERFGFIPKNKTKGQTIWLHAVSVGEILALEHLITKIKNEIPKATIYVTTGTITGKRMAENNLSYDYLSFLPFDFLLPMLLAFTKIKPTQIILAESEIWPNFLLLSRYKKIPTYLINARINKKQNSIVKYIFSKLYNIFEHIYTQSPSDQKRFINMGIKQNKISVLGNIKAFNVFEKYQNEKNQNIAQYKKKPALLVGSIHPGELDIYLNLFKELKKEKPTLQLILAPRHFHWQETLISKVQETSLKVTIWNKNTVINTQNLEEIKDTDILLVIKLGVLFNLYPLCDIFFLGGTFVPIGGHNLLEPAVWGKPSIIGPHYKNTKSIADQLEGAQGLLKAKNEEKLFIITKNLLNNKEEMRNMGSNAKAWLTKEAQIVESGIQNLLNKLK